MSTNELFQTKLIEILEGILNNLEEINQSLKKIAKILDEIVHGEDKVQVEVTEYRTY